jgi:hypothetical protein
MSNIPENFKEYYKGLEYRLDSLEKKLEEDIESRKNWEDAWVKVSNSYLKWYDEFKEQKEQIAELKEKSLLQGKIIAKSNNQINELKERLKVNEIEKIPIIEKVVIDLREVLRDINNSLISLCEVLDTKFKNPGDAISLLLEWAHAEKRFLIKNNEKLDAPKPIDHFKEWQKNIKVHDVDELYRQPGGTGKKTEPEKDNININTHSKNTNEAIELFKRQIEERVRDATRKELIEEFARKLDQWLQGSDEEGIEFIIRLRDEYEERVK